MADEEKDMIDLEVTSFMTACAAGVDALKAMLQRERVRRIEQDGPARGGLMDGEDGGGDGDGDGVAGMRPGSRPAHENAAVTFLFERLKAVTEVAETMQVSRNSYERRGGGIEWFGSRIRAEMLHDSYGYCAIRDTSLFLTRAMSRPSFCGLAALVVILPTSAV